MRAEANGGDGRAHPRRPRRRLVVGIVLHTDVAALHASLDALDQALGPDDRVVLVPDGPDASMAAALADDPRLTGFPQLGVARAEGGPAAFNRLAREVLGGRADRRSPQPKGPRFGGRAPVQQRGHTATQHGGRASSDLSAEPLRADEGALVYLENGARPAPDALDRLAAALDRDGVGIAGPSTNDTWNEQRVPPEVVDRLAEVYGDGDDGHRPLTPLHAPADLCLAVSREVLVAVGGADEGFGRGPCWEMEYAARAHRAGWATVWVGAAYVHRAPPTRRRRLDERQHFDAAKARYQDRLCGLRLDGSRVHHVDHCAGDVCPHFAPPARIVVTLPLGPATGPGDRDTPVTERGGIAGGTGTVGTAAAGTGEPACVDIRPAGTAASSRITQGTRRAPFVSCVMPTLDRAEWLRQAIAYFHRQDHPADARELIVVDDGDRDLSRDVPELRDPGVTYLWLPSRMSIGAKRNLGVRRARGDVVAQWDDDDWYGPNRLSRQVAPIAAGAADITGLRDAVWFDVDGWQFRQPSRQHHRHLFVQDVSGGTLVFHRRLWDRGVRYPNTSLAEDAAFVRTAVRRGFRLGRLPAEGAYLYVRHGTNSWQLHRRDDRAAGWQAAPEPDELLGRPDDRAFYAARSRSDAAPPQRMSPAGSLAPVVAVASDPPPAATPSASSSPVASGASATATATAPVPGPGPKPTVTCIMPTADRHGFLPAAIAGFLAQRDVDAELVIVDDGDEPAGHLVPDDPRIRYIRLDRRHVLGEKRNLAVEAARGEVVVHLDDDDWSHPDRLTVQQAALRQGDAEVCGLARLLWWDPRRGRAWRYTCPPMRRPWVAGNTLAYLRDAWRRSPFPAQPLGEDTAFVWGDRRRRVRALDDERLVVGTLHAGNTSPKHTRTSPWSSVDPQIVLRLFEEAVAVGIGADAP